MPFGIETIRIIVACLFIYNIVGWDSFAYASSDSITPLSNGDAISDEKAITPLSLRDVGFATMEIPSKSSVLRSWRLHLSRPQGKRISSSQEIETAIVKQLDVYVGGPLASKRILPVLELYDGLLSAEHLKSLKEKGISPEEHSGAVYFARFRRRSLQIQVLGQVDQFLAIFIALPPGRKSEYSDSCKSLFPKIEIEKMDDSTGKVYSRGVCDHHLRKAAMDIRAGSRKHGETTFYGIRVNVDIAKMRQPAR